MSDDIRIKSLNTLKANIMINNKKDFSLILIALFLIFNSCNIQNNKTEVPKLQSVLDSLKTVYAPDSRVALWNITVTEDQDYIKITGKLDNIDAKNAVSEAIKNNFLNVTILIDVLPTTKNEQIVTGLINNSVANLRSNPRHSAEIATQALLGTPIRILKRDGDWYLVQTPNKYIAWVDAAALVRINKEELKAYKEAKKIVYNKQYGFSYSEANVKSQVVTDLVLGCILPVIETKRKFYKVGYPDGRTAWVKKDEFLDFEELAKMKLDEISLVETAKKFNGIPYLWGGTSSKAIDCSGFTSTVYFMNGTVLQRDASQQTKYGKEITTTYDYSQLRPGDLLFYGRPASDSLPERVTHVALYMNDGEFIHASGKVRINSINSTHSNFISTYPPRFVRAIRVKGNFDDFGIQHINDNDFYKEIINSQH